MSGAAGERDVRTVERRSMILLEKRGIIKRFDLLDTLSFFAFCMSVPLFLPVLEQWRGMTSSVAVSWSFLPSVSFSAALSLAAMFTALAFLFICLLKTAHARVSRTIMLLALACYAIGYGLLDLWSFGALDGSVVEAGSGLMMGFGAAVMCHGEHRPGRRRAQHGQQRRACEQDAAGDPRHNERAPELEHMQG